jgi:creatinine amidohydrolase
MDTPAWGPYERLRPDQIETIRAQSPIAYLPWGALQWHSHHCPIGLDGTQAHGQCLALAMRTGGVVLPPVYAGTDTIEHSPALVRLLCMEYLEQLVDEGFRLIVIVTGHSGGGHIQSLRETCTTFQTRHSDASVWLVPSFEPIKDHYPSNHAARGETSFQLLFNPTVVALERLPQDREPTLDDDGVWGPDPREATMQEGRDMLDLFCERCIPHILGLLAPYRRPDK